MHESILDNKVVQGTGNLYCTNVEIGIRNERTRVGKDRDTQAEDDIDEREPCEPA